MSFGRQEFRGRFSRGRGTGGTAHGFRHDSVGRGYRSRGQPGFQSGFTSRGGSSFNRGSFQSGLRRGNHWSTGFEAGRSRSPQRDDRFGGHTLDSSEAHVNQLYPWPNVKQEDDETSRPLIGEEGATAFKKVERKPSKMGRIIIRNLPFSTKEDDLKTLMNKCGKIVEVRIPLKDDGKMRGFAFVQFQSINSAETAIKIFNASKFKDRPIAVDWAVAKSRYDEAQTAKAAEVKEESKEPEPESDSEDEQSNSKNESSDHDTDDDADDDEKQSKSGGKPESSDESNAESDEDDGETSTKKKKKPRAVKKPSDVEEGRTLFIRNLPYEETEESLLKCFRKFGVVRYFKLCSHTDSGHSKGTGFVQYREKESVDKCLYTANGEGVILDGRTLLICLAENPKQRRKAERSKHEKIPKDNRNLSLLKEGKHVLQEDKDPMSQNDMRKRSELDKKKMETLKNLNMFVSTTRLSVHNIPKNIDDRGLRDVFLNATGLKKYAVKESRVIRDLQTLDHTGVGKSRGFGFIEFKDHRDAMKALVAVNNNPKTFKSDKRPIVEFALENRIALQKRQRRMENSQMKLASLKSNKDPSLKRPDVPSTRKPKSTVLSPADRKRLSGTSPNPPAFKPSAINRDQSKPFVIKPTRQGNDMMKNDRPGESKKTTRKRKRLEPAEEQDDFSKIVEKYKKRITRADDESSDKTTRWFDG